MRVPYSTAKHIIALLPSLLAERGLSLNHSKTVIFETKEAATVIDDEMFRSGTETRYPYSSYTAAEEGDTIVGTPIGSRTYIEKALQSRIEAIRSEAGIIGRVGRDIDAHMGFTIGRMCTNTRMAFLARTVHPDIAAPILKEHDLIIQKMILAIVDEDTGDKGEQPWIHTVALRLVNAQCSAGGLGIRPLQPLCRAAYMAGILQSLPILHRALASGAGFGVTSEQLLAGCPADALLGEFISPTAWSAWRTFVGTEADVEASADSLQWSHERLMLHLQKHGPVRGIQARLSEQTLKRHDDAMIEDLMAEFKRVSMQTHKDQWLGHAGPNAHTCLSRVLTSRTGHNALWIHDTGLRYANGEIRKGDVSAHFDGPLTSEEFKSATRHCLGLQHRQLANQATAMRATLPDGSLASSNRLADCMCTKCVNTRKAGYRPDQIGRGKLDRYGLHATSCDLYGQRTKSHNAITDVLYHIASRNHDNLVVAKEELSFKVAQSTSPTSVSSSKTNNNQTQKGQGHERMRLDIVLRGEQRNLSKISEPSKDLDVAPDSVGAILLDVTLFHPGAGVNMVTTANACNADAYFDAACKSKYTKYAVAAEKCKYHLVPIPISVYGGIHRSGAKVIQALIDSAVKERPTELQRAGHVTPWESVQHRSRIKQGHWRTIVTAIQRQLVRNTRNAYLTARGETLDQLHGKSQTLRTRGA
jgi:hypothetical protein